jgi:CheY-like chemotaxis protein
MIAAHPNSLDVLYIEDSSIDSVLMELIARRSRCNQIQSVMTAELGLELVTTHKPRLILMDIYLPGMDGLQATYKLKNDAATCDIPVIAVSSDSSVEMNSRALAAGCADFFVKPFDIERVISTLNHYLAATPG